MREVLLVTMALLSAEKNANTIPAAPISARYSSICADYDQRMAAARGKGAPQDELRRIGEARQQAFRELLAAGLGKPEEMKAADLAAIAMAAEYLFKRDECIKHAFRAIESDPGTKEAYAPLVRSLLNENRIDDAETALASAEKHVHDGTKWHGLHYFLYRKHSDQKHWNKAVSHLETVFDTVLFEGGENAQEIRTLGRYLSDYLVTAQRAGLETHSRQQLHSWLNICTDAIERKANEEGAGADALQHCAALCEVQCEIAKRSPELFYDDYLLFWAKVLYDLRWADYEEACRSQQMYYGKYIESNAANVKSWSNVAGGFSQLLKDHFAVENKKRSEVSKSILIKLQAFAESRIASEP